PVVGHGGYSFTAPKVRPATMLRCTSEKMISAGISVKIEIAAILPHCVPVVVTYSERPVVMVRALKLVRVAASRNSFQAKTQIRISVTARPGLASGQTTSRIVCHVEQPSTVAASSSSFGTPATHG